MKFVLALAVLLGSALVASDHIDGPATSKHKITDLTDFFAFETPEKPGYLTLIANVHPLTRKHNHFSDKVYYRFTLREAVLSESDGNKSITTKETSEKRIVCTFVTPEDHGDHTHNGHQATCMATDLPAMKRTVDFNEVRNSFDPSGLRVFAGHRADPFFFNAKWAKAAAAQGKLLPPKNDNTMERINVLSVVVDVDVNRLFGHDVSLLALTVESVSKDPFAKEPRFDRIGRPEVTNVTMVAHAGDKDLRDLYNVEKPFQVSKTGAAAYAKHIQKNVAYYDNLDRVNDWTAEKAKRYSEIIVDDFLLVDLSKARQGKHAAYFGIEMALLDGRQHESCGGRRLDDDIMDRLFTILINAGSGKKISDGVDKPSPATSETFPYLGEPDFSWKAGLKAAIADLLL